MTSSRRSLCCIVLLGCSAQPPASSEPTLQLAPTIIGPRALFDRIQSMSLAVYEKGVSCNLTTGRVSGVSAATPAIAKVQLSAEACAGAGRFCGALELDQSKQPRVFVAEGNGGDGALFASACTTATVDSASVQVNLALRRILAPATCGNSKLEFGESCEPQSATDQSCPAQCKSAEWVISEGSASNGTAAGSAGDQREPAIAWAADGGADAGRFYALYTYLGLGAGREQVAMRRLAPNFVPETSPVFASKSTFLPSDALATSAPAPSAAALASPALATTDAAIYAVYVKNISASESAIELTAWDGGLRRLAGYPLTVASGAGIKRVRPKIARGPLGKMYIAWAEEGSRKLLGRGVTLPATLSATQEIASTGQEGEFDLAGTNAGFVMVWESNSDVRIRSIGVDGTPSGGDALVNEATDGVQAAPRVDALAAGAFCVAFTDRSSGKGRAVLQRFTAFGRPLAGDQTRAYADVPGDVQEVAVAISAKAVVLGWIDGADGSVRARLFAPNGGPELNPIDGTEAEMAITSGVSTARRGLRVRIGPADTGAFVWQDSTRGIVATKFPMLAPQ